MSCQFSQNYKDKLSDRVWLKIYAMTKDAAPGSINPNTFGEVAVQIVLDSLERMEVEFPISDDPPSGRAAQDQALGRAIRYT